MGRSTLPAEALDLPGERRARRVRRAALAVVVLFVLAGLTGQFGVKARTTTRTSDGGLRVRVTYPSRARPALAIPLAIRITKPGGFDGPIQVATNTSYLDAFDENGLNPDPASATTDGRQTIWTYSAPEGDTLTIWFDTRIEPGVQWRRVGHTTVATGGEQVRLDYTTWILP